MASDTETQYIVGNSDNSLTYEGAAKIYQSGKPVIGINYWGVSFFQRMPNGANEYPNLYSADTPAFSLPGSVIAKNPNDIIWSYPNKMDTSKVITISYESIYAIQKTNWTNENNISFGYTTAPGRNDIKYYTLYLENNHYFLWGYNDATKLSDEGKKLFVNVVDYMTKL